MLLQLRDDKEEICNPLMWNFFGGKIEDGESVYDCAVRELNEELCVSVDVDQFELLMTSGFESSGEVTLLKLLKPLSLREVELKEGCGLAFVSSASALKMNITLATRYFIEHIIVKEL
ncbi:NUDIX domain-containing protein [Candidatus Uhrbacteria bacterium]|jgi:8-oxo-dGTP pyrophosphatase MutT (NUDIX family)|nr:NUDIX domain-containing protein [Candidatus Uhrbacteria bacterium]